MCMPALGGRIKVDFDEFDKNISFVSSSKASKSVEGEEKKRRPWYQELICLDIV